LTARILPQSLEATMAEKWIQKAINKINVLHGMNQQHYGFKK
jgi:hypothetical protein